MENLKVFFNKNVVTIREADTVLQACRIMEQCKIGALVIAKKQRPVGIFSERDLLNKVVAQGKNYRTTKVKDVMTTEIKTVDVTDSPYDAYNMMTANNVRHLPLCDKGRLVGVLSIRDLLRIHFLKRVNKEKIETWMTKGIRAVRPEQSVMDVVMLMKEHDIGSMAVVSRKKLVGMFSERDLLKKVTILCKNYKNVKVKDVMSTELITAKPDTTPYDAYNMMVASNIRHLPVVKKGELAGIVSIKDLLRFNMRVMEQIVTEQEMELHFLRALLEKSPDERNKILFKKNEELRSLATVDDLTKLYNHKFFEATLEKEIARSQRNKKTLALLFLDIDHFKYYNDTNDHERGNILLKEFSEILVKTSRQADTAFKMLPVDIVARYGGEEFVMILPETDTKGACIRANRLLEEIRNTKFYNSESQPGGRLTASIGVAIYPKDATEWKKLVVKADKALYKAKETGRDRVVCCGEQESIPAPPA